MQKVVFSVRNNQDDYQAAPGNVVSSRRRYSIRINVEKCVSFVSRNDVKKHARGVVR